VTSLEARRKEVARLLDDPGLDQREPSAVIKLNRELAQLADELETATAAWEELAGKMQGVE